MLYSVSIYSYIFSPIDLQFRLPCGTYFFSKIQRNGFHMKVYMKQMYDIEFLVAAIKATIDT